MVRRVIAYIDGFNIFYSCLKGTPHKWLDLVSLCESMLRPGDKLVSVKYFSALVNSFNGDTMRTNRQKLYIDALSMNSKIEVQLGYFSTHKVKMPLAKDFDAGRIVLSDTVIKTEEKGTDVNLAVQLVADAKDNLFDYAMLFSNDSDMAHAIKIAARDCKKQVGLFIDRRATTFRVLKENVLHIKRLLPSHFAAHQLPDEIKTSAGRIIRKPKDW